MRKHVNIRFSAIMTGAFCFMFSYRNLEVIVCPLQIITMRTQFGFIKCCERPGEMFFHFSALTGGPEAFAVGDDVEFSITREPKGERLNAVG